MATTAANVDQESGEKTKRESCDDSEDESENLEESPCGRWLKRREEVQQRDIPGIDAAYLAMDTEEGVEVVWNEVNFSERKNFKYQEDCPGTQSENAGKADACAGCPNQNICASGKTKEPDPDIDIIKEKLSSVKHIILVLSGKGGVGKSTVTSLLAQTLAEDSSKNIGVMDIDICGPSIPRIFGVEDEKVHLSGSGWSPVFIEENLCVMSVGFLLQGPEEAVIWRGPKKIDLIKKFLKDVDWGELDYLVIDTPPGTSDEHMSIVQYLQGANLNGAVIVTTPQETALLDVRKEINFCQRVNLPVFGVVENMSIFICPKCKVPTEIFPPNTGGGVKMAEEMKIPFLGKLPLNSEIGKACDEGKLIMGNDDFPAKDYMNKIVEIILKKIETTVNSTE